MGSRLRAPAEFQTKQEILINSHYYDVTNWIPRHPGGKIIKFYTKEGEDASAAFDQFHGRCITKVTKFLKQLPKRDAAMENPTQFSPENQSREGNEVLLNQELSLLKSTFEAEGLFTPSYFRVFLRFMECLFLIIYGIYLTHCTSQFVKWIGLFTTSFGIGRCGWFGHEAGHRSLTGNIKIDKFLHQLTFAMSIGLSPSWWNSQHNRHHAMPQRLKHDVDLETLPLIAFNKKVIKDSKLGGIFKNNFFIRNQAKLFLTVDTFLVVFYWRFFLHPRYVIKKRAYADAVFMSLHHLILTSFLDPVNIFIIHFLTAIYLLGTFTLNHTHLEVTEEEKSWVEYGLEHTVDITSTPLTDWWMGYLNFQIEHHLFPQMPQYNNHLIRDRVAALAKKYDLPYQTLGFWEAWGKVFRNLEEVGNHVASGGGSLGIF
ncbi:acyl-lipid (8-3)-desaturase-like [Folsomia candida]|uniref:acyl-lipid (8-3)-desaturase-like n=1 Tax=Folsomia candida TaxID=158441 RepID=UPI000B8F4847|nr:acyl-lipid (8-3)-desaturase-like [Folsomia candida]